MAFFMRCWEASRFWDSKAWQQSLDGQYPQGLKMLINEGDLIQHDQTLTVTEQGRPRLNGVLGYLLG